MDLFTRTDVLAWWKNCVENEALFEGTQFTWRGYSVLASRIPVKWPELIETDLVFKAFADYCGLPEDKRRAEVEKSIFLKHFYDITQFTRRRTRVGQVGRALAYAVAFPSVAECQLRLAEVMASDRGPQDGPRKGGLDTPASM